MEKALQYSDVWLVPKKCVVESRSECDTSVKIANRTWGVPMVPANMKCTIDFTLARWMVEHDYFYILHRFYEYSEIVEWVVKNQDIFISLSLGVKSPDYELITTLKEKGVRIDAVTIDIAHGHSMSVKKIIEHVRIHFPQVCIIAGNVASAQGFLDLGAWGADAVKVGVGGGSACSTKFKTGFTYPMYSCVQTCARARDKSGTNTILIADGSVTCNGDIAKAIHAGADMVMAGGIFGGCIDSPTETITVNGQIKKIYFGSASEHNKGTKRHVEGFLREVECSGMTYEQKFLEIQEDLQSAISYSGGTSLKDIREVEYVTV